MGSRGQDRRKRNHDDEGEKKRDFERSDVNPFNRSNMKTNNATPNTILSNK